MERKKEPVTSETPETDNEETNKVSDSESDTDQANNAKGITLIYILLFFNVSILILSK